jgi:acetyl esterase/lipase
MNTWIFEEYLSFPAVLYSMYKENIKSTSNISRSKIQFGNDEYQYALIMKASETAELKKNTIFFIHGGGWAAGSAESFAFVGSFFARLGFNVILGGYRHSPKYKYPAQLEDTCEGLAAGIRSLKEQGAKVERVIAAGQSAGAQLAGLLVLDEENLRKQGMDPGIFSAMILISGPMNFSSCNAKQIKLGLHGFLRNEEDYSDADPIRLVREDTKWPVLCIHGGRDPVVDIKNSISFYDKIKGGYEEISRLIIAEDKHHIDLLRMFMRNTNETKALINFLYKIEKNVIK